MAVGIDLWPILPAAAVLNEVRPSTIALSAARSITVVMPGGVGVQEFGVSADARPRLIPNGDVKDGRYVSGTVALVVG